MVNATIAGQTERRIKLPRLLRLHPLRAGFGWLNGAELHSSSPLALRLVLASVRRPVVGHSSSGSIGLNPSGGSAGFKTMVTAPVVSISTCTTSPTVTL